MNHDRQAPPQGATSGMVCFLNALDRSAKFRGPASPVRKPMDAIRCEYPGISSSADDESLKKEICYEPFCRKS